MRSTIRLGKVADDVIPSSTMWHIVRANPPMPGNSDYKEPFVLLHDGSQLPVKLREEVVKAVRGVYRPWNLNYIGKYSYQHGLPEDARAQADFSYFDEYDSEKKWKQDLYYLEGNSVLWNEKRPGRIGAFPLNTHGTVIYKFEFASPVKSVTLSDKHTQWGPGDVTSMWTSVDGEHWVLRYSTPNARFTKDYYYEYFEQEFENSRTFFVKYYFYAGDASREVDDNRGASLEEFSLAVVYKNSNDSSSASLSSESRGK